MKMISKKVVALVCMVCMVTGVMPVTNRTLNRVEAGNNEYTQLTFSDFGIADQNFSGGTSGVMGKAEGSISTLDKTIISGKITLSSHVDEHLMVGGAEEATSYYADSPGIIVTQAGDGKMLIRWQYNGTKGLEYVLFSNETPVSKGFNMLGDTITFKIQLDYTGNDVKVTMTMDNGTVSVTDSATFAGIADKMSTNLAFNPWVSNCSIASVQEENSTPDNPDKDYKDVTFKDFGIHSQSFGGGTTGVFGKLSEEYQSLEGVRFSGQLKINYHLDEHLMFGGADGALDYYASTAGIILSQASDGMLILRSQIDGQKSAETLLFAKETPASKGMNMTGDVLTVQVQFDYVGEDVKVTVTVSNGTVSLTDSATLVGIASKLTTNAVFNPWLSACKIASTGETIEGENGTDKEPAEVTKFTEVTFDTFRIKDRDYENNIIYGKPLSYMKDFDKVAFSGYVTLAKEKSAIRIGCTTDSLEGLILSYDVENKQLVLADGTSAGRGNIFTISEEETGVRFAEKEFKFRITLDYYGDGNVRIHLYINDVSYGKVILPMYASYLNNNVILVAGTHIGVRSVEGALSYELTEWESFIRSKVDFSYFGFTDNWDKEMDAGI